MTVYSWANQSRRYDRNYPGQVYRGGPNKGVAHTTETTTLPGYSGGANAPHLTIVPNVAGKTLTAYQHFDSARPSRALVDKAGGVQTNNDGAFQVELVGTCSKAYAAKWGCIYWPDPPQWARDQLRSIIAKVNADRGIPNRGPARGWLPYPASYGNSRVRMSQTEWDNFAGWCGHQHVPENDHGDPGDLSWLLAGLSGSGGTGGSTPIGAGGSGGSTVKDWFDMATDADLERVLRKVLDDENVLREIARFVVTGYGFGPDGDQQVLGGWAVRAATYGKAALEAIGQESDSAAVKAAVEEALAGYSLTLSKNGAQQ